MEIKTIQQKKNVYLNREELLLEITSDSTPKMDEVKDSIKKDKDLVVVRSIHSPYGKSKFLAEVLIYDSIKSKNSTEVVSRKTRDKMKEDKKAIAAEAKKKKDEAKKVTAAA